jgi:hypothetical protein
LIRLIELSVPVVSVDPIWKSQTASGLFWPSSVRAGPVSPAEMSVLYVPATSVCPPKSSTMSNCEGCPAASLYAVSRSAFAPCATSSFAWMVPFCTTPGGKPVISEPGATPRLPLRMLEPVLVTLEPARTAKDAALPRPGAVAA